MLIPFPFTDLTSSKVRPALIVSKVHKGEDVIVCFISSGSKYPGLLITKNLEVFEGSGLKVDSVVRFDKIATLDKKLVLGELGILSESFLRTHKSQFVDVFGF